MDIPEEFRGRVYKFKMKNLKKNPKILDEIKKDFPDAGVGNLFEMNRNGTMNYTFTIEFHNNEDYTAFRLRYGDENV